MSTDPAHEHIFYMVWFGQFSMICLFRFSSSSHWKHLLYRWIKHKEWKWVCRYEIFHPISSEPTFLFNLFKIWSKDFWLQKGRQAIRYGLDQGCYICLIFSMCICGQWWFICSHSCCLVAKSCLTLCKPMDCSLPGSSVYGIFQARMLEWVAISFSTGSSWPRDQTHVSSLASGIFITKPPGKPYLLTWLPHILYCSLSQITKSNSYFL